VAKISDAFAIGPETDHKLADMCSHLVTDSRNCPVRKTDLARTTRSAHMSARHRDLRHRFASHSLRLVSRRLASTKKVLSQMIDFILIHGAWHGSWCWARVRSPAGGRGGTGLFNADADGCRRKRSHLLSRDVGLDTHVADCGQSHDFGENLRDIVLVGTLLRRCRPHAHVADRIARTGFARSSISTPSFPKNGKNPFLITCPTTARARRKLAVAHGDGWRVPPRPASFLAVNAAGRRLGVDRQCTMHPLSQL